MFLPHCPFSFIVNSEVCFTLKTNHQNLLFMAGKPISVADANAMVAGYASFMHGLGINMATQTESISFTGANFSTWLGNVMPFADELRIFMGVYPLGNQHAGRTTVIIWPYKNGQPATDGSFGGGSGIEPFNDGMGNP
jgi:hypothetical protein